MSKNTIGTFEQLVIDLTRNVKSSEYVFEVLIYLTFTPEQYSSKTEWVNATSQGFNLVDGSNSEIPGGFDNLRKRCKTHLSLQVLSVVSKNWNHVKNHQNFFYTLVRKIQVFQGSGCDLERFIGSRFDHLTSFKKWSAVEGFHYTRQMGKMDMGFTN